MDCEKVLMRSSELLIINNRILFHFLLVKKCLVMVYTSMQKSVTGPINAWWYFTEKWYHIILCTSFFFRFSFQKAFFGVVKETDDLAGQHELISETLMEKICKELHSLHTELKTDRRKVNIIGVGSSFVVTKSRPS